MIERRVLFGVDVNPKKAQFVIRDGGPGFDTSEMKAMQEPAHLSSSDGGRGLTLIGSFMDEVVFNTAGNEFACHCIPTEKSLSDTGQWQRFWHLRCSDVIAVVVQRCTVLQRFSIVVVVFFTGIASANPFPIWAMILLEPR